MRKVIDSGWICLLCGKKLTENGGISLDCSVELHVCRPCWQTIDPAERLRLAEKWRTGRVLQEAATAFRDLCTAACNSNSLTRLRGFGEN
jgi:ribosome-binding protein aMBF1 (putative translation factor)